MFRMSFEDRPCHLRERKLQMAVLHKRTPRTPARRPLEEHLEKIAEAMDYEAILKATQALDIGFPV